MKKVAILGFGTVGGGVAEILERNAAFIEKKAGERVELSWIVDLRDMPDSPFAGKMVKDFAVVENDPETTVVVEAIGGCGAALQFVRRALTAGKSVVTSNKQLVAEHGLELTGLAREHGCNFLFEASVGGGIPVLHPINRCLGANELWEIAGILNGTTNFILTRMLESGADFDSALAEAQKLGYAEQNPAADVEGIDAGRKICILADLAFGKNIAPEYVAMEGITKIAPEDAAFAEAGGMKLKLLGRAVKREGRLAVFVSPHFVPETSPLAPVRDVYNAILVRGSDVGETMFYGLGAGRYPTASAVLGDVIDIVSNPGRPQPAEWGPGGPELLSDPKKFQAQFFIRTKADKKDAEKALGHVSWLPDQAGWHGGVTEVTTREKIENANLALAAVWPVFD